MAAKCLMVQGTASSVGKSLLVAALCRIFANAGFRVAPFKAQNMSNNAAALPGGGEIGRAQALQALAAGIVPRAEMNPVLLKPEADARSQVVLLGKPYKTLGAGEYYREKAHLWAAVASSLDRLRDEYELVLIEGAGSPAEINLKRDEIVNMAVARYANSPVLLVGDIDPGGIFAQFVGTLSLLEAEERNLVRGLVVNKFRGDLSLLEPGLAQLEGLCRRPVLGVIPWLHGLELAEEDGATLESDGRGATLENGGRGAGLESEAQDSVAGEGKLDIAVLRLPRISNFDDMDALSLEPGLRLRFVSDPKELGRPAGIIIPGTKATLADLDWLRARGFDDGIRWLARLGTAVVGLCGGFQILGECIEDPLGVEGPPRSAPGLGLLPTRTRFLPDKQARPRRGRILPGGGFLASAAGLPVEGYEIHAGSSSSRGGPLIELEAVGTEAARSDGAASPDGRIFGTYLHGLFDRPEFRAAWLASLRPGKKGSGRALATAREEALDRLADGVAAALDMEEIRRIVGL